MYDHEDVLKDLNSSSSLGEKLGNIHRVLKSRVECIDRIAVALYDRKADCLQTLAHSSGADAPLEHYQVRLSEAPALEEILQQGRPRVANDLAVFADGAHPHTQRIRNQGYRASYTMPMYMNGVFFGFVFFNSYRENPFNGELLHHLDVFGHLVSLVIINEIESIRLLLGAVRTAQNLTFHRDNDTGTHMDRMSYYARLIARELADRYDLDDDFIEHVTLFSSLHDIGKLGIPDQILLKPGKLTEDETKTMQTHPRLGRKIIDELLCTFDLGAFQHIDMLRNIAEFHHEAMNGSGYPRGLKGDEIPIEARIAAVADVFDALTSRRPYKDAWDNDEAFATLRRLSGTKFDQECVAALVRKREEVEAIQARFREDQYG